MIIDSHIHLHEFGDPLIRVYCGYKTGYLLLAVSDDLPSSQRTLEISSKCSNVLPAVGIHPWRVERAGVREVDQILQLGGEVKFLGEIGLDLRFVPSTFQKQLEIFRRFLEVAERHGLGVSVHGAGAWRHVIAELKSYKVRAIIAHWFTGSIKDLKELLDYGSFIGINPAIKIQAKSKDVVRETPLEAILTESDSPYRYRGLDLRPELIQETIRIISNLKGVGVGRVREVIEENFKNLARRVGYQLKI